MVLTLKTINLNGKCRHKPNIYYYRNAGKVCNFGKHKTFLSTKTRTFLGTFYKCLLRGTPTPEFSGTFKIKTVRTLISLPFRRYSRVGHLDVPDLLVTYSYYGDRHEIYALQNRNNNMRRNFRESVSPAESAVSLFIS